MCYYIGKARDTRQMSATITTGWNQLLSSNRQCTIIKLSHFPH